jgi:hypothetical protein
MRRARLAVIALVCLVGVLTVAPAVALAADPVTLTGTVTRDGAPVAGVELVVTVVGQDEIVSGATDDDGAFAVDVDAGVGSEIEIFATGQTSRSDPDEKGCVSSETPVGRTTFTIDSLPPAPVEVVLDTVLTDTVCTATPTPEVTPPLTGKTPRPRQGATPPATDTVGERPSRGSGSGFLLVLAGLALAGAGSLATLRHRR